MSYKNSSLIHKGKRIGIFVDYANLQASVAALCAIDHVPRSIEAEKLIKLLASNRMIGCLHFFCVEHNESSRPYFDHLHHLGVRVHSTKVATREDGSGKANLDVDLVLNVVDAVTPANLDAIVIASGDGDFVPLVRWVQKRNIRVTVAGFRQSTAYAMKFHPDEFVELDELKIYKDHPDEIVVKKTTEVATT